MQKTQKKRLSSRACAPQELIAPRSSSSARGRKTAKSLPSRITWLPSKHKSGSDPSDSSFSIHWKRSCQDRLITTVTIIYDERSKVLSLWRNGRDAPSLLSGTLLRMRQKLLFIEVVEALELLERHAQDCLSDVIQPTKTVAS